MKNIARLLGIIAIIALIGLFAASCDNPTGGGDPTHTHQWGEWAETTPAAATTDGVETKVCSLDPSHTETRPIPATFVNWAWVYVENGVNWATVYKSDGSFVIASESFLDYWVVDMTGTYSTSGSTLSVTIAGQTHTSNYTVEGNTLTVTPSVPAGPTQSYTRRSISINIGVFTPPSSHTPLTQGQWKDGSISSSESEQMYSFTVTAGTTYYVWWNDFYGDGSKTLDVDVIAYHSNGTELFHGDDVWDRPPTFTASSNGTAYLWVRPIPRDDTGTFAIVYSTSNTRP